MSFQVDYFPVGEGSCCGDAISLCYWSSDNPDQKTVAVIDGGNTESGEVMVEHIINFYGTKKVDYVFSTHLDADHIKGLRVILEKLEVGTLFMHQPWEHASETSALYKQPFTQTQLESKLQKSLDQVAAVEKIAVEKEIPIEEVFAGDVIDGNIFVLGPSKEYYEELTAQFRDTPEPKSTLTQAMESLYRMGEAIEEKIPSQIFDFLHIDILGNGGETSAENNSSLILMFEIDGQKLLFSGDAGIPALTAAADRADSQGISLMDLRFFHVPHHGSKHNLGSNVLKRIKAGSAIVSASTKCHHKHPSKRVTNALYKNNTYLNITRENVLLHAYNAPRPFWGVIEREPFHEVFDED